VNGHGDISFFRDFLRKHAVVESINEYDDWLLIQHLARYVCCLRLSVKRNHRTLPLGRLDQQGNAPAQQLCVCSFYAERKGQNMALR
jgi:hypothetical protein